jgi:hypothetical protein
LPYPFNWFNLKMGAGLPLRHEALVAAVIDPHQRQRFTSST